MLYYILNIIIFVKFVRPLGLEPRTPALKGRCSNQLSYGRNHIFNIITIQWNFTISKVSSKTLWLEDFTFGY